MNDGSIANPDSESTLDQIQPSALAGCPFKIGRYEIRGHLGRGLSDVYLGWDPELQRKLAIKVLRRSGEHQNETRQAQAAAASATSAGFDRMCLLDEARKLVELDCDGVARVFECSSAWITLDGVTTEVEFMVYKWIDGSTLDQWFVDSGRDIRQLTRILIAVAAILGRIHRAGIVHRDIKPANLLIDKQGRPVVIDFGLAIRSLSAQSQRAEGISGTLPYISPEQANDSWQVDGRSDLYSLGATIYRLITDRYTFQPPRPGASVAEILQYIELIRTQPVPPFGPVASTIPQELERICLKLLAKRPTDRYQSAWDLVGDLQSFVGDKSLELRPSKLLVAVQSQDAHWADTEAAMLEKHMRGTGIWSTAESPVRVVSPVADTDAEVWRMAIMSTMQVLRAAKGRGEWIHLAPRFKVLAGFALGMVMDHQHDCQLYHVQANRVYAVWRMDRATKNSRSPVAGQASSGAYLQETFEANERSGLGAGSVECLAIQIGANPILLDVAVWRDLYQPTASIRCLTKPQMEFPPEDTSAWVAAAGDIARAIKASRADALYLFYDGPCTLALMAGDAIGHWTGKPIHLMQYVNNKPEKYVEVLSVPDERLRRMLSGDAYQ